MRLGRIVTALAVGGAAAFAVLHPDAVKAFYEDIYPNDPAKRQALELCFTENHKFNRLDAGERDACYRRTLYAVGDTSTQTPVVPTANPIDLRQAAGQGRLQRNDIRRAEQTDTALHAPR